MPSAQLSPPIAHATDLGLRRPRMFLRVTLGRVECCWIGLDHKISKMNLFIGCVFKHF